MHALHLEAALVEELDRLIWQLGADRTHREQQDSEANRGDSDDPHLPTSIAQGRKICRKFPFSGVPPSPRDAGPDQVTGLALSTILAKADGRAP